MFIYLAALGLRFSTAGLRLRTPVARLVAEHQLWVCGLQEQWRTGSAALWPVGSSRTRDRTRVPCMGRQILYRWTTREVQKGTSLLANLNVAFPAHTGGLGKRTSAGLWLCRSETTHTQKKKQKNDKKKRNHKQFHIPLQCCRNSLYPLFNFKITLVIRPRLIIKFVSKEVQLSPYQTFD